MDGNKVIRAHKHRKLAQNDPRAGAGRAWLSKIVRRRRGSTRLRFVYRRPTTWSEVQLSIVEGRRDSGIALRLGRAARHRRRGTTLGTTPPWCCRLVRVTGLYFYGVEDNKIEIGILVNFGTLVPVGGVLYGEGVEMELFLKQLYLFPRGVLQVDPEEEVFVLD